jgi:prevent-host-death family protein
MNNVWQFQDAKNELGAVMARTLKQGPQLIARDGEKIAVVISYVEYEKLRKAQRRLSEFFRTSLLASVDLERDKSLLREDLKL